jgi:alkylation response protein AidB-like acyl-CoA dehydrogenase
MSGLNSKRLAIAAECLGLATASLEDSLEYANEREQFGKRIAEFQMIREKLARMAAKVEAIRTMLWNQAFQMVKKGPAEMTLETASINLFASETAFQNAIDATHIFGGYG